ncbi:Dolichyl-diphosphooligosaccharide--protein glycotransferase [Aphelenchoides fujianensis]|nr:Dolichyl-diphosphooligosaccharide--protein glycotransferase [Aphelenchoides fujianensis]
MTDNAAATSNPPASTPQMPPSTSTTAIGAKDSKMGITSLLTFVILTLAWIVGFSSRLFAIVRFESIIHEFDPWFNYRSTAHMVENGFYEFMNWFDERAWYPLGRIVGGTVFPGLMFTSGVIHYVLHALNFPIHIREVCVFLAPFFSGLTAIATYLLTKELWSAGAGLFAACFIAIAPGYTSRSVAGSYDNEGIAIFALQFTYFLWLRAVRTGSITWGILTAISYFYMCLSWGGFVFIANLLPLHCLVLILLGRFSNRLYIAYTTFYCVGQLLAMQLPFIGYQPVGTSEHMAAFGVFGLMQLVGGLRYMRDRVTKQQFYVIFVSVFTITIVAGVSFIVVATWAGYIQPWTGRFYSLWDTGYAKIHIPIIASVSEHQPTTWLSFFFDLHVTVAVFPAGLWICVQNLNDARVFVILYAVTAAYFAGVMVRLMLTFTPVVCVLAGIAFSNIFEKFMLDESAAAAKRDEAAAREERRLYDKATSAKKAARVAAAAGDTEDVGLNTRTFVSLALMFILLMYVAHCTYVTSNAYSHPSVVLQSHTNDGGRVIMDDFREAYYWLRQNTPEDARIMSWWDYGYQIAGMANRTTLVDNNTWNNSHIALVGMAMSSNESFAFEIMKELDVDYVLVIFGGVIGYSGDDINKFLWMVRIAEGEHPKIIREADYFTESGEYSVGVQASKTMTDSIMYRMSYYRFGEVRMGYNQPGGFDRTRGYPIGVKDFELNHLEEAYTSENWLVRVFRVVDRNNRPDVKYAERQIKSGKSRTNSKKSSKNKKGVLKTASK